MVGAIDSSNATATQKNPLLVAALEYQKLGWWIFPVWDMLPNGKCRCGKDCGDPGKHPRTRHGWKESSNKIEIIKGWWGDWPHSNIGLLTGMVSGVYVLDVDPRNGGLESLKELIAKYGPLPKTLTARSGSGGLHLYFKYPGDTLDEPNKLGPGLDFQGEKKYVILPPSNHKSGKFYRWIEPEEAD